MRRIVCTWVVATGTALGMTAILSAQQPETPARRPDAAQAQRQDQRMARIFPHGEVIGLQVVAPNGQEAGTIEGLVVSLPDGMIRYAAVSGEGISGSDDQLVALPWAALELQAEEGQEAELQQAKLAITPQSIRQAKSFAKDQKWPEMPDASLMAAVQRELGEDRVRLGFRGDTADQEFDAIKISKDVNVDVKSTTGETIGKVNRFMIDASQGKVAFVTVGKGGVLGVGETLTALPLEALSFERDPQNADQFFFALAISQEAFQQAPKVGENPQYSEINQQVKQFRSEHVGQASDVSAEPAQPQR